MSTNTERLSLAEKFNLIKEIVPPDVHIMETLSFLNLSIADTTIGMSELKSSKELARALKLCVICAEDEISIQERPKTSGVVLGHPKAGTFNWD